MSKDTNQSNLDDEIVTELVSLVYLAIQLDSEGQRNLIAQSTQSIKQLLATEVIRELESLKEKQFWAADDAYDAGDVVDVKDIDERIAHWNKIANEEQE